MECKSKRIVKRSAFAERITGVSCNTNIEGKENILNERHIASKQCASIFPC